MTRNRDSMGLLHGRATLRNGLFTTADDAFSTIILYEQREVIGMNIEKLYRTSEGAEDFLSELKGMGGDGRPSFIATTWCLGDGSVADIVVRATASRESTDGSLNLEICDSSPAHRSSRLAKIEESTLSAIMEHSPLGFGLLILDPSGNRVMGWHNPAMARIFGYEEGGLWGKSSRIFYKSDEDFARVGVFMKHSIEEQGSADFLHQMEHKDGSSIDVRIVVIPINLGNEIPMLTIVEDRSKQVETERRYRHLFELSIDGLFVLNSDIKIVDCNPAALKLFNYESKERMLGLSPVDLSPEFQPGGNTTMEKIIDTLAVMENQDAHLFEWRFLSFDGREFDGSVLLSRIEIDGVQGFHTTVRDISEQKRTQELLIQSEKMMSVGGLAAGMAHEINNPLAGVLQNATVLKNRLTNKELPANLRAARSAETSMEQLGIYLEERKIPGVLDSIFDAGTRMSTIVNNMLNFARKSDSSFSQIDPATLVDRTIALASNDYDLKKNYDFRSIEIFKEYDDDLPTIQCIDSEMQQVLLNILNNGAHAMFAKKSSNSDYRPSFHIRLFTEEDETLCISIEDNGPGVEEDFRRQVFEPFFTTKPVGEGTGLGLSVSYFIVTQKHGGTLDIESELGKGTRFIIRLPTRHNRRP